MKRFIQLNIEPKVVRCLRRLSSGWLWPIVACRKGLQPAVMAVGGKLT